MKKQGISRRSFLGLGAAATVGAMAAGTVTGCAPQQATPSGEKQTSAEQARERNPQDDSYTSYTTDYAALFSPIEIGGKTLKNRIVKAGATSRTVSQGAGFSDDVKNYYGRIAEGGTALIWMDPFVDFTGKAASGNTPLATDADAALIKEFTDSVHEQGALIGMQLVGFWNQASCDGPITAPFENYLATRKMMSIDEIHSFQEDFIHRAVMLQKAGFDGVELNAGCDHTFASFLSRHYNTQRDDEYGPQSFENRARILTEIIAGIKAACGSDFLVEVLFNGIEENVEYLGDSDDCMKLGEAVEFAKLFEQAGADMLEIRYAAIGYHAAFFPDVMHVCEHGNTGYGTAVDFSRHFEGLVNGQYDGACALLGLAAEIKKAVGIPVGTVGNMDPRLAPDLIDNALANGDIDYIVVNRALMCDPDMPSKLQEGRRGEVAPCNHCLTCLQAVLPHPVTVGCRCNATFGRVKDGGIETSARPVPAETPKNVMVIGGGPAGMEAARIAASRGHAVTLYEEDDSMGGRMTFAATVKGPHEKIADFTAYLQRQLEVTGVEVKTGKTVDAALVDEIGPDAVIVAVGGIRPELDLPGASENTVVLSIEEAGSSQDLPDDIVIVGDNHHAVDMAINLTGKGKKITVLSPRTEEFYDVEHPSWIRYSMKNWFTGKGGAIYYEPEIVSVDEGSITIRTAYGIERTVACGAIVNCQAMEANTELFDAVSSSYEAYNIGDSATFSTIAEAISAGNQAGRIV